VQSKSIVVKAELFAWKPAECMIVTRGCFVKHNRLATRSLLAVICSLVGGSFVLAQPPGKNQSKDPPGLEKSKLRPREGNLKVGDAVPDLKVWDIEGKNEIALRQLKGKPVVLIFGSCT
jgi:hypothetical protein